jgi:hypothetical protein
MSLDIALVEGQQISIKPVILVPCAVLGTFC